MKNNLTVAKINRAIRCLGLELVHERGAGYSYFTDLRTRNQVGDSVYVCYLNHLSQEEWVAEARSRIVNPE